MNMFNGVHHFGNQLTLIRNLVDSWEIPGNGCHTDLHHIKHIHVINCRTVCRTHFYQLIMMQNKANETFIQSAIKFKMQRIGDMFDIIKEAISIINKDKDEQEYRNKMSSQNLYTMLDKHDNSLLHLASREGKSNLLKI